MLKQHRMIQAKPIYIKRKNKKIINRLRPVSQSKAKQLEFIINTPILIKRSKSIKRFKKRRKTNVTKMRRRIYRRIRRSFITKKRRRVRRNLLRKSYFYRYILRRYRRVYNRTIGLLLCQPLYYQDEQKAFEQLQQRLRMRRPRQRIRYKRQRTLRTKRIFAYGTVYVSYRKRNLFITVFKMIPIQYTQKVRLRLSSQSNTFTRYKLMHRLDKKQVFKCTGALQGYTGPKRNTKLGRESVAKATSAFIFNSQFTCVDLIFNKHIGRLFTFIIRGLFLYPIFLRHIYISKRRSHGFTRLKKIRRT